MKKTFLILFCVMLMPCLLPAQDLSLDSLRSLALRNNKSIAVSRATGLKTYYEHKAARTNYLPKISAVGSYMRTGNELSLLSEEQKNGLQNMGTTLTGAFGNAAGQIVAQHPELASLVESVGAFLPAVGQGLNGVGNSLVDALRTDTRNMTVGAVLLMQPLYMGGKIRAYDRITHYSEDIAGEQLRAEEQTVVLDVDRAYWQVVSLAGKKRLAESYVSMLRHLDGDMQKLVNEGVKTRADQLAVGVKLGEAEMTLTKVENGLSLSRMLLCDLCGLPLDSPLTLVDEHATDLSVDIEEVSADAVTALTMRPELQSLEYVANIYQEKVNIERSSFLPQLALTGGYFTTNPGLTNGFENRFRGTWAVGVTLKVPVWNWGEGRYKVRAAKAEAQIAGLRLDDAREKVSLQVSQSAFRVNEAGKQYRLSQKNMDRAEENLRIAQAGFREEVVTTNELLAAQTAWLQAQSEKIDAQVDLKVTRSVWQKALGTLQTR